MKSLNLIELSKSQLSENEMSKILGSEAGNCGCGCPGPSSNYDNSHANWESGLHSVGVDSNNCHCLFEADSFTEFNFFTT